MCADVPLRRLPPRPSHRMRASLAALLAVAMLGSASALAMRLVAHDEHGALAAAVERLQTAGTAGSGRQVRKVDPGSGLIVVHQHVPFVDHSARHHGAPPVSPATGIVVDADTGEILWTKEAHLARPPASTAKILSSLVAVENFDMQRRIDVTPDALGQEADETKLGMQVGDTYTVAELLQAMLMISANDAASAMAVDTVGRGRFVLAMNEQLAALGLHDSHFATPVGLDDPHQYASAYDLAALGIAAYDSSALIRQAVATRDADVPATDGHIAYHLHNISSILGYYPPAVGIKPGFTESAGYCLVAMAVRNGHRLVTTVMGEPSPDAMMVDVKRLFEWGFAQDGLPPLPPPNPPRPPAPAPPPAAASAAPSH